MTTVTTTPSTTLTTRSAGLIGAAVAAVAAVLTTLFAHGWSEVILMVALIAVASAAVYGFVVPRALRRESCGGTALALAVPAALLAAPAFWTGLPLVLGVAAVLVGNSGRHARTGSGKAIAGLVLGALAALFYLSIYVMEGFAGNTGFLLA